MPPVSDPGAAALTSKVGLRINPKRKIKKLNLSDVSSSLAFVQFKFCESLKVGSSRIRDFIKKTALKEPHENSQVFLQ